MKVWRLPHTKHVKFLKAASLCLFVALMGAGSAPAVAHPHAWIDIRSAVLLDGEGRVTAIEEEWLFDEFYTLFVLGGWKGKAVDVAAQLKELARINLENLKPYGYFTEVHAGDSQVRFGTVTEFQTSLRDGRLWLQFVLPLDRIFDPKAEQLSFSIFDPTYYIEMLHMKDDVVAFRGGGADGCFGQITPPNPTTEAVMLAAALDKNAQADNTLGAIFAERVKVTCR